MGTISASLAARYSRVRSQMLRICGVSSATLYSIGRPTRNRRAVLEAARWWSSSRRWPTRRRVSCEMLVGSLGSWRLRYSMAVSTELNAGRSTSRTD